MIRRTGVFLLILSLLLLISCGDNSANENVLSMEDAVKAMKERYEQDFALTSGVYVYTSEDAYKKKLPAYEVKGWGETTDNEIIARSYRIDGNEILQKASYNYPLSWVSEQIDIDSTIEPAYEEKLFGMHSDRIHEIVDMVKKAGHGDIAADVFAKGLQLKGGPFESYGEYLLPWYVLTVHNPSNQIDVLAAAYNTETNELFVPKENKPYIFPRIQDDKLYQYPKKMSEEDIEKVKTGVCELLAASDHPYKNTIDTNLFVVWNSVDFYRYEIYTNSNFYSLFRPDYTNNYYIVILGDTLGDWEAFSVRKDNLKTIKMLGVECENEQVLTMAEPVQAVKEQEKDMELTFIYGAYTYPSAEALNKKEPVFDLTFWDISAVQADGKGEITVHSYKVDEKITKTGEFSMPAPGVDYSKFNQEHEDTLINALADHTHKILHLAKEKGYGDLTAKIFDQGFQLLCAPQKPWFLLMIDDLNEETVNDDIAAIYNIETNDLFVLEENQPYIYPRPQGNQQVLIPENISTEKAEQLVKGLYAQLKKSSHPYKDHINTDFYAIQPLAEVSAWPKYSDNRIEDGDYVQYGEDYIVFLGDTFNYWEAFLVDSETLEPIKMVGFTSGQTK
ncbi:MAG: hypothetical protein GX922_07685 [Firmicutes bacterium]|nr:hypothetical protein [Bacillota bacterium]